ncbi:MAG: YqjD family protein [Betaproteobacteria bacterium]
MDRVEKSPSATDARERLTRDMRSLVHDAEDLLHAAQRQGVEGIASVRDRLEESLRQAKAQVSDSQALVFDRARQSMRKTNEAVQGHPWTAVGVAAGVGLLIGALLMRR